MGDHFTEKLKPCPFCGGTASLGGIVWPEKKRALNVSCDNCGASTISYHNRDEAYEAWNRRRNDEA